MSVVRFAVPFIVTMLAIALADLLLPGSLPSLSTVLGIWLGAVLREIDELF